MAKVAIIGAGGIVFGTTLLNDLLQVEALKSSTFALMAPSMTRLKKVEEYTKRLIHKANLEARVYATTDRRDALKDADYVLWIFQIGGMEAYRIDYEIPLKYGIDTCVSACVGPGGVFRALRTIPVVTDILHDMEELCPDAYLLNYVNPMCPVCISIGRVSSIQSIGLCHGIQTTLDLIAGYVGVKKEEINFEAAGINHMAWFLKLEKDGRDLYPILSERMELPEYYLDEKVRGETMRHFGYFMTESSGHLSDYLPWFRKNAKSLEIYCDRPGLSGESGVGYHANAQIAEYFSKVDILNLESHEIRPRSIEYCSYIIEALEGARTFKLNGNVMNTGYITNLPEGCCVEVPVFVDKTGIHPVRIGDLPMQLAAMNQSNVTVQMLAVEAALKGDPELAFAAIAMDPLTSAVLTLKEIRDMTAEMFEASQQWLPQFKGKSLPKYGNIHIPEDTKPHPAPTDPALAITQRFGKMAEAILRDKEI